MLRLRQYKKCDADKILSWCRDEHTFTMWGGDHIGSYPLSESVFNSVYFDKNGNCAEEDNFYPVTAFDDGGIVGHFIIRYINGDRNTLRFGWVIVDDSRRGQGIGRKMLMLGLEYAFGIMGADIVTIGVFEDNIPAYRCYLSAGFHSSDTTDNIPGCDGPRVIELYITKEKYKDTEREK